MWYPDDSDEVRPVQASFFVAAERGVVYHETTLIDDVPELEAMLGPGVQRHPTGSVQLDGAVSLVWCGEELLGPNYWIEFTTITSLWNLVCEHRPDRQTLNNSSSQWIDFSWRGGEVAVSRAIGGMSSRTWMLPARELVTEWLLMEARVARLRAELGCRSAEQRIVDRPIRLLCDEFESYVDLGLLTRTYEADLVDVFLDPRATASAC